MHLRLTLTLKSLLTISQPALTQLIPIAFPTTSKSTVWSQISQLTSPPQPFSQPIWCQSPQTSNHSRMPRFKLSQTQASHRLKKLKSLNFSVIAQNRWNLWAINADKKSNLVSSYLIYIQRLLAHCNSKALAFCAKSSTLP